MEQKNSPEPGTISATPLRSGNIGVGGQPHGLCYPWARGVAGVPGAGEFRSFVRASAVLGSRAGWYAGRVVRGRGGTRGGWYAGRVVRGPP